MKSRILVLSLALFALFAIRVQAQVDVTINPIGLLFGGINVGADFALSEEFSIEANIGYNADDDNVLSADARYTGIPVQAVAKYYFGPEKGADKFYGDVFLRYVNRSYKYEDNSNNADFNQARFGFGIGAGYKVVSKKNIVFDIGFGVGRVLVDNTTYKDSQGNQESFDFPDLIVNGKLGIGYRF